MLTLLKRHQIQVLLAAGHLAVEVARFAGVGERTVRRVGKEAGVIQIDDSAERQRRRIGRPSKVDEFRDEIAKLLKDEPELMSLEILRRLRQRGYGGQKTALYDLVRELRPANTPLLMRFERAARLSLVSPA